MNGRNFKGLESSMEYDSRNLLLLSMRIRDKVRMVVADEEQFCVLSTTERIAVAVVLDRVDLLLRAWGTIAESIHRLGPQWTSAALYVQRRGWKPDGQEGISRG